MSICKRIVCALFALLMVFALLPSITVRTAEAKSPLYPLLTDFTFQKDYVAMGQRPQGCVISSAAMILRRAEIINGVSIDKWEKITEKYVYIVDGNVSFNDKNTFTPESGIEYFMERNPKTPQTLDQWKELLANHPEGVLVWCYKNSNNMHAVALTHYDENEDTFYCMDPASGYWGEGMIKLENSLMGKRYGKTAESILNEYCVSYWTINSGITYHAHTWNSSGQCPECEKYYSEAYSHTIVHVSGTAKPSGNYLNIYTQPYAASKKAIERVQKWDVTGYIINHYGNKWYTLKYGDSKEKTGYLSADVVNIDNLRSVISIQPSSDVRSLLKGLTEGNSSVYLRGTALSSSITNLRSYTMWIYSYDRDDILYEYTANLSGKSHTISTTEDNKIKFSKLTSGQYSFFIEVFDEKGTREFQEWDFYVQKKAVPKYTVSFNANEGAGAPSSQTVSDGTTIYFSAIGQPQRDQYNFLGWAFSEEAETPDFLPSGSITPRTSMVLHAVWEPIEPPSATKLTSKTVHAGTGKEITVSWWNSPRARSYTVSFFDSTGGKYFEASTPGTTLTTIINSSGNYTVQVKASNVSGDSEYSDSADIIVHDPSIVTFLNHDGSTYSTQSVAYGENAISPGSPEREGYTFEGWSDSLVNIQSDRTVSAVYEAIEYSVTFLDYNGEVAQITTVCYDGDTPGSVTPPDESLLNLPTGYTLAGWDTDAYLAVKKDVVCSPCSIWANYDIPITTTVGDVTPVRANGNIYGYWVNYTMTNHTEEGRNGRAVIALKSGFGKFLTKTESNAFYLEGNSELPSRLYVPISTDIRGENFASTEVYIVDAYSSMIPLSQIAVKPMGLADTDWTDWGTQEELAHLIDEDSEIETKNQYRFKTLQFSAWTTNTSYLDWELYQTSTQKSNWSAWGNWQNDAIVSSENVDVETREVEATAAYNMYRYNRYKSTNCSKGTWYHPNQKSAKDKYGGDWTLDPTDWSTTQYSIYEEWSIVTTTNNAVGTGIYSKRSGYWRYWWHRYIVSSNPYYWEETQVVPATYKTQYRSRTREDIPIYQYCAWTDWSAWSDTPVEATNVLQVETRELIRVKLEQPEVEAVTISGIVPNIENVSGKQAILTIYKVDEASDYSNEYIAQTTLGSDGSYTFANIRTLETPSIQTGDFTATLTIEGASSPLFIDTGDLFKAPKPTYSVTFVDEISGEQIGEKQIVIEGDQVTAPEVAAKEGYTFIGWEYGLTNIRDNMTIKARYIPKSYTVVYVDWQNDSVAMENGLLFGSSIEYPVPEAREGYDFIGWKNADGNTVNTVTGSMILYAQYEKKAYTVTFLDGEGNVVSEQEVEYGGAAVPPELELAEGTYLSDWSDESYLNVTGPLVLTPNIFFDDDAPQLEISIYSGVYEGNQTISISCEDNNADIIYRINYFNPEEVVDPSMEGGDKEDFITREEPEDTEDEFVYTEPFTISETAILEVTCKTENTNPSQETYEYIIVPEGTIPDAPQTLSATANSESIDLTWDAVEGADGYMIYKTDNFGQVQTLYSSTNTYTDNNLSAVSPYWYEVSSVVYYEYRGSLRLESELRSPSVGKVFFGDYSPVSQISIESKDTVLLGNTIQLNAIVAPENAYDNTVEWTVQDDSGAATITSDGLLTATRSGTVTVTAKANDGSEIYGSKTISIVDPNEQGATIQIDSEPVIKGYNAHVIVNISEGTGASMMQFTVRYDPSVLRVVECTEGSLFSGFNPTINTAIQGEISFVWDGIEGVTEGGDILDITFAALDSASTQETLIYIEDGSDDNYQFLICRWNESGELDYLDCNIFSDTVQILECEYGDVDMNGNINVIDANIIRRYSAKLDVILSDAAMIIADVNGDGKVNVIDANLIRRYCAKLISEFPVAS